MIRLNPKYIPLLATAVVLLAIFGTGSVLYPNFGTPRVIVNLLNDMAFVGVAAVVEACVVFCGRMRLLVGSMDGFVGIRIAHIFEVRIDPLPWVGRPSRIGAL